jgi:hypothetical protein
MTTIESVSFEEVQPSTTPTAFPQISESPTNSHNYIQAPVSAGAGARGIIRSETKNMTLAAVGSTIGKEFTPIMIRGIEIDHSRAASGMFKEGIDSRGVPKDSSGSKRRQSPFL